MISSHIRSGCHTNKTTDTTRVRLIARSSKHNALVRSTERGSVINQQTRCQAAYELYHVRLSHSPCHRYSHSLPRRTGRWDVPRKEYCPAAHPFEARARNHRSFVVGFCLVRALSQLPSPSLTLLSGQAGGTSSKNTAPLHTPSRYAGSHPH